MQLLSHATERANRYVEPNDLCAETTWYNLQKSNSFPLGSGVKKTSGSKIEIRTLSLKNPGGKEFS